jgi:outer membrane protein OmpA-like peptidoglycan-associated protein
MADPKNPNPQAKAPAFEIKPGRYTDRSVATGRRNQTALVGRERRVLAAPNPDPQAPDITGRYQDTAGSFTVAINQAGSHIECWVGEVLTATTQRAKRLFRLGGDLKDSSSFTLYTYPDPTRGRGGLKLEGGKLAMTLTTGEQTARATLVLNETRATLSEAGVGSLPESVPILKAQEWFPLTKQSSDFLRAALDSVKIAPFLQSFFAVGSGVTVADRLNRAQRAKTLDDYLATVFSTKPPDGWHPQDTLLVRHRAQQILHALKLTRDGATRSLYGWIEIVFETVNQERFGSAMQMPSAAENLQLQALTRSPDQFFRYEAELVVSGLAGDVGIGLGGFVGGLTIAQFDGPGTDAKQLWKHTWDIWIVGISAGPSVGLQMGFFTRGTALSPANYAPEDIPGWVSFVSASGPRGGVGIGGTPIGATLMLLEGTGVHPKLAFDFTGWTLDSSIGGALFEVGMTFGRINLLGVKFSSKGVNDIIKQSDYAIDVHAQATPHFALGDALLNADARQLLRIFCAAELVVLSDPTSRITVNGHADRVDTEARNDQLSLLRAQNVVTALKDILGGRFKLSDDRVVAQGLGERAATAAKDIDGQPNPNFRKVELIVDSRLTVTLHGQ